VIKILNTEEKLLITIRQFKRGKPLKNSKSISIYYDFDYDKPLTPNDAVKIIKRNINIFKMVESDDS